MRWAAFRHLFVILFFTFLTACDNDSSSDEKDAASADSTAIDVDTVVIENVVPVETKPAAIGDISSFLYFNSTIETEAAVEVHSQLSGYLVKSVRVEEGDRVEAGDILVMIEDKELQVALQESEVDLRHLQVGYDRTEEMFRRRLISDQEYEAG